MIEPGRSTLRTLLICAGILSLLSAGARAGCSSSINFGQQGEHCAGDLCFFLSPGFGVAGSLRGSFWALGHGDPAIGAGADNGNWELSSWLKDKPEGFKIKGDWVNPSVDGCVQGLNAPGTGNEVMVAALSDTGLFDEAGYFAVAAVERGLPLDFNQFDFAVGIGESIELAPIPIPVVTQSIELGGTHAIGLKWLTLEELESGFYSDGSTQLSDVVVGRRIYQKFHGPSTEWTAASPVLPLSAGEYGIQFSCLEYFAAGVEFAQTLVFDSGYETEYRSGSSIPLVICSDCHLDSDLDGYCDDWDCDPFLFASPRSIEWNDPWDNRCDGLYNDIEPQLGYYYPGDKDRLSWRLQPGATQYEILRSESADFSNGCTSAASDIGHWTDPELPAAGGEPFHYLVRAVAPHAGSLGRSSSGDERVAACP